MHNTRLQLTDSGMDCIIKLSEGNPGALTALMKISSDALAIDPQSALGGMGKMLELDSHGIYGSNIWILFSDECKQDTRKLCVLLRGVQLGIIPPSRLTELSTNSPGKKSLTIEEFEAVDLKVCDQLSEFKKATQDH